MTNYSKIVKPSLKDLNIYLILLFPVTLIAGPLITEISILGIIILSYPDLYKKKNIKINRFILIYFLAFLLYLLLNTLFNSISFELSFKNSFFYFRFFLYAYFIFIYLDMNEKVFFKKLYLIISIIILLLYFDLIIGIIFKEGIFEGARFSSVFGSEKILGSYLIKILPVFIICTYLYKKNVKFIFFWILLTGLLIILSGERTAFISYMFLILGIMIKPKFFKITVTTFFIFFVIFASLLFLENKPTKRIFYSTIKQMNLDEKDKKLFSFVHENMVIQSYLIFKENIFFGTGPKTYRIACKNKVYNKKILSRIKDYNLERAIINKRPHQRIDACETHPHNLLSQIISELGLVGIIFYIIFYCYIIREFFFSLTLDENKSKYIFPYYISVLALGINLCPFIPSGNFFNNWFSYAIYYPLGFFLFFNYKLRKLNN